MIIRKTQNKIQDPVRLRRLIGPLAFTDTRSARAMKEFFAGDVHD